MAIRALNGAVKCFAFETVTVTVSSTPLTASVYNKVDTGNNGNQVTRRTAVYATISVETDTIRYRIDGTAPTSTVGHILNPNDVLYLASEDDIRNFKAIRSSTAAADVPIMVSYA